MFQLAAQLDNPVNLAIGQADFDVPQEVKTSLTTAVDNNHNDYALTQGILPLREKLQAMVDEKFPDQKRKVFVTSGTSAGLTLACLALINPGDEVLFADPYFALYPSLVKLAGGVPVTVDSHPDFRLDVSRFEQAVSERTKMIIVNSPGNPTGCCWTRRELEQVAQLASDKGLVLISDEIYSAYNYDQDHQSPASFNDHCLVIDGFSKSHAMAGLRLAYVHGPAEVVDSMIQLQQFTFVCAPHPVQWAGLTVLESDTSKFIGQYREKRDWFIDRLQNHFEINLPSPDSPGGAFYLYPRLPWGDGKSFFQAALDQNLILIPGTVFSESDSHFRISYAVSDEVLQQGADLLIKLAQR